MADGASRGSAVLVKVAGLPGTTELKTSDLTAMRDFEYRDGKKATLALEIANKTGRGRPNLANRTIDRTAQIQSLRFDFSSRPSAMLQKGFSASIPGRFILPSPVRIGVNFARVFFGSRRNALARCGLRHSKRTVEN
jgi:hypothetical protein